MAYIMKKKGIGGANARAGDFSTTGGCSGRAAGYSEVTGESSPTTTSGASASPRTQTAQEKIEKAIHVDLFLRLAMVFCLQIVNKEVIS